MVFAPAHEGNMANSKSLSAMDAEIIKSAFRKEARSLPESQWHELAAGLFKSLTGSQSVDPALLEWIMGKEKPLALRGDQR
jgi:hypothetical protein